MKKLFFSIVCVGLLMVTACAPSVRSLRACDFEDGSNMDGTVGACVWDAKHQGNGKGDSLIYNSDGTVTRIKN
ncbi:hypothetical protein ACUXZ5_03105 [Alloscardovia omnicolens]|uniref:hypothetical protein n=1 Tax=Alloscardovia omnicolens TaxID=419015 RepID=UPI0040556B4B